MRDLSTIKLEQACQVIVHEEDGFQTKWTKSDCGQVQFGGWKEEAMAKFAEYYNANVAARALPTNAEWEQKALEYARKVAKVQEVTQPQVANGNNSGAAVAEPAPVKVAFDA